MELDNQQERLIFDIGWLVGLIDGEGCFSLFKYQNNKHRHDYIGAWIIVVNTNKAIIDKLVGVLNSLGVNPYIQYTSKAAKEYHKTYWRVSIRGFLRVQKLLDKIYPLMECRREAAGVLKRFIELRLSLPKSAPYGKEEWELFEELRILNQRGISKSPETIRQASTDEDIVRPSVEAEEIGRNDQSFAQAK